MAYSDKVIDHYEHPRNVGSLDKNDPNVGTGLVGAPACGDVMKLQLRVNDEGLAEPQPKVSNNAGSLAHSAAQGERRGRGGGGEVQVLRLRLGHRLLVAGHRVGEGHERRSG